MQPLIDFVKARRTFVLYTFIGLSGVVLDFVIFVVLNKLLGIDPLLANVISTSVGITNNFILNTVFNFKTTDKHLRRFITFYAVGLFGLLLSTIILQVAHGMFGIDPVIAKVMSLVVVLFTQYALNKKITFATTN